MYQKMATSKEKRLFFLWYDESTPYISVPHKKLRFFLCSEKFYPFFSTYKNDNRVGPSGVVLSFHKKNSHFLNGTVVSLVLTSSTVVYRSKTDSDIEDMKE